MASTSEARTTSSDTQSSNSHYKMQQTLPGSCSSIVPTASSNLNLIEPSQLLPPDEVDVFFHGVHPSELISMKDANLAAQKTGKEMYSDLPSKARKMKFEEMINTLQIEIDDENEKKSKFYAMKKLPKPPYSLSKIDQQITKSEQRSESLKYLMLQYRSGLESCEVDT